MKTIQEIRQQNFKILRGEFKSQRAFADAIEATPGYVSQLLIGSCKFGEKTARKIEKLLDRPEGWMQLKKLNLAVLFIEFSIAYQVNRKNKLRILQNI